VFVVCIVVSAVLAFLVMGMGAAQLNGVPQAVEVMKRVGAGRFVRLSGILLLLAALGLIVGLFWAPIGVAASAGLVLYFLIAVGFHIKIHDSIGQILNPLVPAAISALALWLRIATM
jgi:hypothetical protein